MLFIFSLALVSLTFAADSAATDAPAADSAPAQNQFISFTPDNVAAFGTLQNLLDVAGESDAAGLLVGPGGVGAGQQIVSLGDGQTIIGSGAATVYQCDECDLPVSCVGTTCTVVYKAEHDNDQFELADGVLMTPVTDASGNAIAVPGLAQNLPLMGVVDGDVYGFDGFDGLDLEDLLKAQAAGFQVSPTVPAVDPATQADLVAQLAAMYPQNGYENPLSDESLMLSQQVQAFAAAAGLPAASYSLISDTVWGESDILMPAADGTLQLNPDNFDRLLMIARKPSQSSKPIYQDPFFWSFAATSVILLSLAGIVCTRKRRNVTLDDVLMETNYSSHI